MLVYTMSTLFPFVEIPDEFHSLIGQPAPGTRLFRRSGSQEESAAWFELLTEIIGPSVSPGGVSMYCPVSRAAVHKRVKEGRLSMFLFHVTCRKTTLFGENKILRDVPYGYIPVSECRAWREELEQRAVSQGRISREDLEGAKPDWHGDFLQWADKRERMGFVDYLNSEGMTVADFLSDILKSVPVIVREEVARKVAAKRAAKRAGKSN